MQTSTAARLRLLYTGRTRVQERASRTKTFAYACGGPLTRTYSTAPHTTVGPRAAQLGSEDARPPTSTELLRE